MTHLFYFKITQGGINNSIIYYPFGIKDQVEACLREAEDKENYAHPFFD